MRDAIIVFFVRDGEVMLIYSYQDETKTRAFWQGVSGFVEVGESAVTAAVREVSEELGIEIQPENLAQKYTFQLDGINFTVFTTHTWEGEFQLLEAGLEKLRWFPFDQLPFDKMHPTDKDWLPNALL